MAAVATLFTPTPQVAGAVSSLFILLIILKLGELFQKLPKVSRACIPDCKAWPSQTLWSVCLVLLR